MGNQQQQVQQTQYVKILGDQRYQQNVLCNLVGDGNLISLTFGDGDYAQQMRDSKFLKFLDKYSQNKIKLITTVGEMGEGKSLIQNFMIQQFQNLPHCVEIFRVGDYVNSQTKGIQFYYPQNLKEPQDQKEEIVVFFDCEGFDYSSEQSNLHMQNLKKLVCLIANLSTCLIYVHCNTRIKQGFQGILDLLNLDKDKNKNPHNNFIEILNIWNGKKLQSFQNLNKFIQKVFYLRQLNFQDNKIVADENYNEFIQEIKALTEFCKKSKYSNSQSSCQAFEKEQTCKSFKEMLICCFQIIDKQMNCTTELFLEFVNKQLEIKNDHSKSMDNIRKQMIQYQEQQYQILNKNSGGSYKSLFLYDLFEVSFQKYYSKKFQKQFQDASKRWYEQFDNAIKSILVRSSQERQLSIQEQNEIYEQYHNLDSAKPYEIRVYERNQNPNKDKEGFVDNLALGLILDLSSISVLLGGEICVAEGLILMVGPKILFASACLAIGAVSTVVYGGYQLGKYLAKKLLQQQFQKGLFELIENNKLITNSQININQIKSFIRSKIPKFEQYVSNIQNQEEKDAIYFTIFFNNLTQPLDQKKLDQQKKQSFQNDYKIFVWVFLHFNQMQNKNISQIYKLNCEFNKEILDEHFRLVGSSKSVELTNFEYFQFFKNLFNNLSEEEEKLYKLLFLLKFRNEDLFYKFILNVFFEDYINSELFAKLMIENSLIQKTMKVQDKIFSLFS